ncbi:MAG: hypothetical protein KF727_06880 [Microbacteriaceae bacterium]|nr:hypothetical protein [Microbacteriaceae bacterium]
MAADLRIPPEVADQLRYYVYALRDPRDMQVFYVGKGAGSRIASHVIEAGKDPISERAKLRRIREIEAQRLQVDLLFLRTGIRDEETAYIVEQAVIDAFAADQHELTNLVRGHHSGTDGLATLPVVVARHRAVPCPAIPDPVIMVKIQKGWRSDMNDHEIYEKTRGHWKVGPRVRSHAKYCLGIAYGVVRGAYRIEPGSWFPSQMPWDQGQNRWGFDGSPAPELAHVLGTEVREAFPNQVMYRQFMSGYSPGVGP